MSSTARIKTESPTGADSKAYVDCVRCKHETEHDVLCKATMTDGDENITIWETYLIANCGGCKSVRFIKRESDSESLDYGPDGSPELSVRQECFPLAPSVSTMDEALLSAVPKGVQRIYRETHAALSAGHSVLAGIGIRAIVEALCNAKSAKGRNLEAQIDDLASKGLTTPAGAKILHGIRHLGNKAAHEVKAHSEIELGAAMQVVEHLLEGVYVLPSLAKQLPKRRLKKTPPKKP